MPDIDPLRQWVSGWGTSGWLVAITVAVYIFAVTVALSRGWRPSRRFVTWTVAIVAIVLTPVVVGFVAND